MTPRAIAIERQLVEWFRRQGVPIEHFGDATIAQIGIGEFHPVSLRHEFRYVTHVSLAALARAIETGEIG